MSKGHRVRSAEARMRPEPLLMREALRFCVQGPAVRGTDYALCATFTELIVPVNALSQGSWSSVTEA